MRICSLLPSATEILFALGLDDEVVAVSHECDYPSLATDKPIAATGLVDPRLLSSVQIEEAVAGALAEGRRLYHVELDLLRSLRPDLIITQELCVVCAIDENEVRLAADQLDPRPRVLSLAPNSLADLFSDIRTLAEAAGVPDRAAGLIEDLGARLRKVQATSASLPRPRVLCLEWLDPAWIAGHWMPEIVEAGGGLDVLATSGAPSRHASWVELVTAAPEVIIIMPCGFGVERTLSEIDLLLTVPQVRQLPAFASGHVFVVDGSSYYSRAGPRLIDGVELLARLIHPEAFPGSVPPHVAQQLRNPLKAGSPPKRLEFVPVRGSPIPVGEPGAFFQGNLR